MEYTLRAFDIWECGKRRDKAGNPHQEDSIYPLHGQATDNDRLFILCDGMGGHEAGEVASMTVCEAMSKSINARHEVTEAGQSVEAVQEAVAAAFDALDAKDPGDEDNDKKMGTTMTLLLLHSDGATIAHIGDSRVYHIRPGKNAASTQILFQTQDHSLVNDLVRIGELTPEEAKNSNQRNILSRAMLPHMPHRTRPDIYNTNDIQPDDYFYLCSDGMLENMDTRQICYHFSDEAGDDVTKTSHFIQATAYNADNHSAIIVHITDVRGMPAHDARKTGKCTHHSLLTRIKKLIWN